MYVITYNDFMRAISSTELRANLAKYIDRVNDDHEPLIITRAGGRDAVLISLEDFVAIEETLYLISNPNNRAELLKSIDELDNGKTVALEISV